MSSPYRNRIVSREILHATDLSFLQHSKIIQRSPVSLVDVLNNLPHRIDFRHWKSRRERRVRRNTKIESNLWSVLVDRRSMFRNRISSRSLVVRWLSPPVVPSKLKQSDPKKNVILVPRSNVSTMNWPKDRAERRRCADDSTLQRSSERHSSSTDWRRAEKCFLTRRNAKISRRTRTFKVFSVLFFARPSLIIFALFQSMLQLLMFKCLRILFTIKTRRSATLPS